MVGRRVHGKMPGPRDGIQRYLQMQGMDGLLRRLIQREVQVMARTSRTRFKGIGGLDLVIPFFAELRVDFDLEAGYDYVLERYEFIDPNRTVALGASYGGYMVSLFV